MTKRRLLPFFWGMIMSAVLGVTVHAAQVHILCYHTFLAKPTIDTDFSIAEFDGHITTLESKGYRFRTFAEMRAGKVTGDRNVLLVIDDGNRSAYDAYETVLKPRKITALFAIYPGVISTRKFAMTWDQLRDLKANGNEFASHGYFHEFLNQKLKDSRPADFDKEAVLSKQILERELQVPIDIYVYPFGICTVEGKELLKASGYRYAMTIRSKVTQVPLPQNPNPLQLPRTMMTRATAKSSIGAL
ncbi:polysaccharide deacetylase family protein [bacterium]|nr:polysaccharide deacetylase family protein [bacterium]